MHMPSQHSTLSIRPDLELHLPDDPGLLLVRAAEHQHQVARVAVDLIIITRVAQIKKVIALMAYFLLSDH